MKAEKIKEVPSGEKFFATCKHIGYKNVLKTFKSARSLMSAECGLPGQEVGNRKKRNTELLPALLLAGSYDPSSIWFQYFLCKDIDLYCYFFTQGWTQGQYGQYYLYDNLLDDNTGLFAGSSDSSNLATIALLGGLGGGIGQPSGYYPAYGAHAVAPSQGRKRREAGRAVDCLEEPIHADCKRKRRSDCDENSDNPDCMRKRRSPCDDDPAHPDCMRKRRSPCDEDPTHPDCERKRRSPCDEDPTHPDCKMKRRSVCEENSDDPDCKMKRRSVCEDPDHPDHDDASCRKRRQACEACEDNHDSTECNKC